MFLSTVKNANAILAFFLELGVLAALGYWGFYTGQNIPVKFVLGIGAPVIAIVVWGFFGAPLSKTKLKGVPFLILRILFFGSAVLALLAAHQSVLALVFGLLTALYLIIVYGLGDATFAR